MVEKNVQDWEPIIFRKTVKQIKTDSTPAEIKKKNLVVTSKKHVQSTNPSVNLKKIENDDEEYKIPLVPKETAKKIVQGRVDKKWTQQQLANMLSLPIATIKSIEGGEEILNKQQLQKIANILGIKL